MITVIYNTYETMSVNRVNHRYPAILNLINNMLRIILFIKLKMKGYEK